jgi:hypothetical protein
MFIAHVIVLISSIILSIFFSFAWVGVLFSSDLGASYALYAFASNWLPKIICILLTLLLCFFMFKLDKSIHPQIFLFSKVIVVAMTIFTALLFLPL